MPVANSYGCAPANIGIGVRNPVLPTVGVYTPTGLVVGPPRAQPRAVPSGCDPRPPSPPPPTPVSRNVVYVTFTTLLGASLGTVVGMVLAAVSC